MILYLLTGLRRITLLATIYLQQAKVIPNTQYLQLNITMTEISPRQLAGCLILTILLAGLHFAVIMAGHAYFQGAPCPALTIAPDGTNYSARDFSHLAFFLKVAGSLTFAISLALWTDKFSLRIKHSLIALNFLLGFAIAAALSISTYQTSNLLELRDLLDGQLKILPDNSGLILYYKLVMADAGATILQQVMYMWMICGSIDEMERYSNFTLASFDSSSSL